MKPGWRVFAGAAAAVAVWTLGLCAWALVSRGGPTLDLGPTIALETPAEPEVVSPAPLPQADDSATDPTDPADVPDAPQVPAPAATDPAPPVEPQPAPTARAAGTARTAAASPPAPSPPVEAGAQDAVAQETLPAEPAPAAPAPPPAPAPTPADGWPRPGRPAPAQPAAEHPWESVDALEPQPQHGGSTPGRDPGHRPHEPRPGCDDEGPRRDRTSDDRPATEQHAPDRRDAWHGSTTTGHRP